MHVRLVLWIPRSCGEKEIIPDYESVVVVVGVRVPPGALQARLAQWESAAHTLPGATRASRRLVCWAYLFLLRVGRSV
jgi:hypothetical protein